MAKFKIGDKVRCIDTNWTGAPCNVCPVYQGIYTVLEHSKIHAGAILLEEIPIDKIVQGGIEPHWADYHFELATEANHETMVIAKEALMIKEYQAN